MPALGARISSIVRGREQRLHGLRCAMHVFDGAWRQRSLATATPGGGAFVQV